MLCLKKKQSYESYSYLTASVYSNSSCYASLISVCSSANVVIHLK